MKKGKLSIYEVIEMIVIILPVILAVYARAWNWTHPEGSYILWTEYSTIMKYGPYLFIGPGNLNIKVSFSVSAVLTKANGTIISLNCG